MRLQTDLALSLAGRDTGQARSSSMACIHDGNGVTMRSVRDLKLGTRIALYTFAFGVIVGLALTLVFSHYARRSVLSVAERALDRSS